MIGRPGPRGSGPLPNHKPSEIARDYDQTLQLVSRVRYPRARPHPLPGVRTPGRRPAVELRLRPVPPAVAAADDDDLGLDLPDTRLSPPDDPSALRDEFAKAALPGLARSNPPFRWDSVTASLVEDRRLAALVARAAYLIADEMLSARARVPAAT